MHWIAKQHLARRDLDQLAHAHHRDTVCHVVDNREIVRDEQIGQMALALQILQ